MILLTCGDVTNSLLEAIVKLEGNRSVIEEDSKGTVYTESSLSAIKVRKHNQ
jgi:hypothetical protein